jgi:hypothetical protein
VRRNVRILKISTNEQLADFLTKTLDIQKFRNARTR